jgi:molecular chaperone GrpE
VTEIECLEEEFDPHFHDVIESVEKEGESGTIIEVVQKGYKVGDKLLRPAKVKVIK